MRGRTASCTARVACSAPHPPTTTAQYSSLTSQSARARHSAMTCCSSSHDVIAQPPTLRASCMHPCAHAHMHTCTRTRIYMNMHMHPHRSASDVACILQVSRRALRRAPPSLRASPPWSKLPRGRWKLPAEPHCRDWPCAHTTRAPPAPYFHLHPPPPPSPPTLTLTPTLTHTLTLTLTHRCGCYRRLSQLASCGGGMPYRSGHIPL